MAFLGGWRITRTGIVFVVGIIVLAGLVSGGIWLVHERGEQARRQDAAKIAQQNLEEQSKPASSTNNGAVSTPPTETKTDTQPTTETASTSNPLPETGADLNQIIIITLLTIAGAYYVTSRRAAARL